MISTRDRPVEDVQRNLIEQALAQAEGDDVPSLATTRSRRRATAQDAVIPVTPRNLDVVITGDSTNRKQRLLRTLEGSPSKGTVVVAIRGTEDKVDLALDLSSFSTSTENRLKRSTVYQEMRNYIETTLQSLFSPGTGNYKSSWDVFATGHSLGGAITDQLILDGVVKGGVSFAAPRSVDSKMTQPSYSIINAQDGIIGRAFGQQDAPHDLVVPGVPFTKANYATQHNMEFLKPAITATLSDQYAKFNGKVFKPTKAGREYNLTTGAGMDGSGRAPQLHTMYEAAKNAYDHGHASYEQSAKDFLEEGLLLPDLTLRRSGKAIVHFYVYATPEYNYMEMPIRLQIEKAIRNVTRGQNIDDAKLAMMMNNF